MVTVGVTVGAVETFCLSALHSDAKCCILNTRIRETGQKNRLDDLMIAVCECIVVRLGGPLP
jgi:hypothetical protein